MLFRRKVNKIWEYGVDDDDDDDDNAIAIIKVKKKSEGENNTMFLNSFSSSLSLSLCTISRLQKKKKQIGRHSENFYLFIYLLGRKKSNNRLVWTTHTHT